MALKGNPRSCESCLDKEKRASDVPIRKHLSAALVLPNECLFDVEFVLVEDLS